MGKYCPCHCFCGVCGCMCGAVVWLWTLSPPDAQLLLWCHSLRMFCFYGCHFLSGSLHIQNLSCWVFLGVLGYLAVSPGHLVAAATSQQLLDDCSPEHHVHVS